MESATPARASYWNWTEVLFTAGMYWRIIYGCIRLAIGTMLLRLVGTPAIDVYQHVLRHLIARDPDDHILRFFATQLVHHGFSITYFLAIYMLFWGVVDIVLSVALLRHALWAFPVSFAVIAGFIAYEVYRYSHTHSPILLGIVLIDIGILYVMNKEYEKLKRRKAALAAA